MEKEVNQRKVGDLISLDSLPVGGSGIVRKVAGEGRLRRRIFDRGITPGAEVFLRKKAPLGDPIEITLRGYELTLRKSEAENVNRKITSLSSKEENTDKE